MSPQPTPPRAEPARELIVSGGEWSRLKCDCGGTVFFQKFYLITRQGGGTTTEQAGYVCRACNADVDTARLMRSLEVARKRAELKALQDEVGAADAVQMKQARIEGANTGSG